jgi:hypothetical protein
MKKERSNTKILLIDIQFYESLNEFEYQFGETITYKQMEQRSYIDFKEIMFDSICRDIKFRKFGRLGKILTIKAEMLKNEIEKFRQLLENDKIQMSYGWIISNVTLIKDEKINEKNSKFKKLSTKEFEDEEDDEEDEIGVDEIDSFDDF